VFTVGGTALNFVSNVKHLGNIITNDLRDDGDIEREIKCMSVKCNTGRSPDGHLCRLRP